MSLTKYQSMRDFRKTPEPKGAARKDAARKLEFVVQKHQASRLHYDFRLELDGVLKSWAVPKGPSMNPADKRLAVAVEDHPFEYRKFEGNIPEGNYGAGNVIIWDRGTYQAVGNQKDNIKHLLQGIKNGKLDFVMDGEKLKGHFTLVRRHDDEKNWLLVKKNDRFALKSDITKKDKSVVSGKGLGSVDDSEPETELSSIKPTYPPSFIQPMLATLVDEAFSKPGWLYELKLDGYRAVGTKLKGNLQLYSRSGQDFRGKYPQVAEALRTMPDNTVVDGEIVIVDDEGVPQFNWLQNWGKSHSGQLRYYVFDLLWHEGRDIRHLPLTTRKELLRQTLPENDHVLFYCDHLEENGVEFFNQIKHAGLEGIMAKCADSPYLSGERSKDWLKIKTELRQEVVIGGFTEPKGSRKFLGSLLLGVYDNKKLRYVGHSGGGIPTAQLRSLRETLEQLERDDSPFDKKPKPNAPVHWVEPKLLCEVTFSQWTEDGMMRHPKFIGLRTDKPATTVNREKAISRKVITNMAQKTDLKFTNLGKVFWPESGLTKGDLIEYYKSVMEYIFPHLKNRPHVMLRHPNGYNGPSFFQKDIDNAPEWAKTADIKAESTGEVLTYLVCNKPDTLLYMVQLGCVEINPWNSRVPKLENADWIIMDLDPKTAGFEAVIEVAKTIKSICDKWNVPTYPKTSGKSGMHVYIPFKPKYSYEQTVMFAELLSQHVMAELPELKTGERNQKKRKGRVYLDYLRNSYGQTVSAPYSVRPTKEATVSMPLKWTQVKFGLKPTDFTIKNTLQILKKKGDAWKDFYDNAVDLKDVLKAISK